MKKKTILNIFAVTMSIMLLAGCGLSDLYDDVSDSYHRNNSSHSDSNTDSDADSDTDAIEIPDVYSDDDVLSSHYDWEPDESEDAEKELRYIKKSEQGKFFSSFNEIYALEEATNNWEIACQNTAPFFGSLAFDFASYNGDTYFVSTPPAEVIALHKKGGDYDSKVFYGEYDYAIISLDLTKMIILKKDKPFISIDYNLDDKTVMIYGTGVKEGTIIFEGTKDSDGNYTFTKQ